MSPVTNEQIRCYEEEGYVILRQVFSPHRITSLVAAFEDLIQRARAGECELTWIDEVLGLPDRTGGLFSTARYDEAYGRWLDEDLVPQIEAFLGAPGRHSLFGMLNGGGGRAYKQKWHRDLGKPGAPDEEEFLRRHHGRFVQCNAPLLAHDHYLNIVPRSHLRRSTEDEIEAGAAGEDAEMPDAMVVELHAGDIVYYNANLWHRGWNPAGDRRWTMHSAFWRMEFEVMKHEYGQRDDLLIPGHMDRMPRLARAYVQRYLDSYPVGEPRTLTDI